MKTNHEMLFSKSYGAFEMKEYIGKSTLKSFVMTLATMVGLTVVSIALQASVSPTTEVIVYPRNPTPTIIIPSAEVKLPTNITQKAVPQKANPRSDLSNQFFNHFIPIRNGIAIF